ncbi:hypothetical protein DAPPUDRAFT_256289 [Daphnia pulex]|uniref:Uncharacterized protein n=1 Tax=Daphnia pulex TaxID=6669 RepID=E9HB19_DAPPU|nr:hypothetical protein DAPPUDRAFT_256289 [Daphnia pulex]|eukprot:EFX71045.1 hypothetical protein DAPPUDRAFT_256289 [Daphnia pulex]
MKLLALRENLKLDVQRRVENLFVALADYQTSWKALTDPYGAEEFLGASASRNALKSSQPPAKIVKFCPMVRMAAIQNAANEDNTCTVCHAYPGGTL